jgi:hypothetical protein
MYTGTGSLIHYWIGSPEDASAVVLTYDGSMDPRTFDDQLETLLDARYRVRSWDIRDHRTSKSMAQDSVFQSLLMT